MLNSSTKPLVEYCTVRSQGESVEMLTVHFIIKLSLVFRLNNVKNTLEAVNQSTDGSKCNYSCDCDVI